MATKTRKGLKITAIVLASILAFILIVLACCEIATRVCDRWEPWRPNYERLTEQEMIQILNKEELTQEDYATLYAQTGLTQIGIDRILNSSQTNKIAKILDVQQNYFANYSVKDERFAPFTCWELLEDGLSLFGNLEAGDIIVTDATHVLGWRYGHSAIVVDDKNTIVEAFAPGSYSDTNKAGAAFEEYATFMVLRPKLDKQTREEVGQFVLDKLVGVKYAFTAGIFSAKNPSSLSKTQCAHLIWYAYKQFGLDLDSNGGKIVKPQDIANSEQVEVVQIFGFHPENLWK